MLSKEDKAVLAGIRNEKDQAVKEERYEGVGSAAEHQKKAADFVDQNKKSHAEVGLLLHTDTHNQMPFPLG